MHPIRVALDSQGKSQKWLCDQVTALRRVSLSPALLSQILTLETACSWAIAKDAALVIGIAAAVIMDANRPRKRKGTAAIDTAAPESTDGEAA
jgi:hypothetical protein